MVAGAKEAAAIEVAGETEGATVEVSGEAGGATTDAAKGAARGLFATPGEWLRNFKASSLRPGANADAYNAYA